MKKSAKKSHKVTSLLFTSTFLLAPALYAADKSFSVNCGSQISVVEKLSNIGKINFNGTCVVNASSKTNIVVFCNSQNGLSVSDSRIFNGAKRPASNNTQNALHLGYDNGAPSKSRIIISRKESELVVTLDKDYNTQFHAQQSLYINDNSVGTTCDILPFSWSDSSGC